MKVLFHAFNIFILIFFVSFTKEDVCPEGEINISELGQCKNIIDFLENENLNLDTQNLLYLASSNEGKIEKDGYKLEIFKLNDAKLQSHNMIKSKLYFPNSCLEKMENNNLIKLDKSKGIVSLVYNYNNMNKNNISDIYFIIRHNSEDSSKKYINSKVFDFSFCHEDPILFDDEININFLRYDYNDNRKIDIDKILYTRKLGIDLFDPYSDFLNDICFKFTSEKGTDVTLESRLEDYYQNITFCDDKENSHYISYNYSAEKNTFTYRCAFGFYSSEADKSSYLDIIDSELKSLASVSNLKVITCYKKILNLKDLVKNYGGMICILVLIIQIICFLIFCFSGIKSIEGKLNALFKTGEAEINRLINIRRSKAHIDSESGIKKENKKDKQKKLIKKSQQKKDSNPPKHKSKSKTRKSTKEEKGNEIEIQDYKEENDIKNNQDKEPEVKQKKRKSLIPKDSDKKKIKEDALDIKEIKLEDKENKENIKKKSGTKKKKNKKKSLISKSSLPKGVLNIENNNLEIKENIEIKNEQKEKKKKKHIYKSTIDHQNLIIMSDYNEEDEKKNEQVEGTQRHLDSTENSSQISRFKNSENQKDTNDEKKSKNYQLYKYNDDELNELPFEKSNRDHRSFCAYYISILKFSHIILNVFLRRDDYNLFVVKLGLLLMTFPINLTFNIFFYTNKKIKLSYIKSMDDISAFWNNISNTILSSVLAMTLLIILKLICLTHNSVKFLRKIRDVGYAKKKSVCVLRCIKIRVSIYFILSLSFLIIFGFYNLCFCAVFENTQVELIKSTFTSWLISLTYPFIICFFTACFRSLALKFKNRCLYAVKMLMQLL